MKYLKSFEKRVKDVVLYDNGYFNITLDSNNHMCYNSHYRACSPCWGLADEITKQSKYIDDIELRNIILTVEEKRFSAYSFVDEYRRNRIINRNSAINNFLSSEDKNSISNIPDKVYEELDTKYIPIFKKIIEKSKTLGDVIDEFKIIHEQINIDLSWMIKTSKYNI